MMLHRCSVCFSTASALQVWGECNKKHPCCICFQEWILLHCKGCAVKSTQILQDSSIFPAVSDGSFTHRHVLNTTICFRASYYVLILSKNEAVFKGLFCNCWTATWNFSLMLLSLLKLLWWHGCSCIWRVMLLGVTSICIDALFSLLLYRAGIKSYYKHRRSGAKVKGAGTRSKGHFCARHLSTLS